MTLNDMVKGAVFVLAVEASALASVGLMNQICYHSDLSFLRHHSNPQEAYDIAQRNLAEFEKSPFKKFLYTPSTRAYREFIKEYEAEITNI